MSPGEDPDAEEEEPVPPVAAAAAAANRACKDLAVVPLFCQTLLLNCRVPKKIGDSYCEKKPSYLLMMMWMMMIERISGDDVRH